MGAKGLDLLLWMAYLGVLAFFATGNIAFPVVALVLGLCIMAEGLIVFPRAQRLSRVMGLNVVVIVPVWRWWAKLLVRGRVRSRWSKSYEVHVNPPKGMDPSNLRKSFESDLATIKNNVSGLLLWETSIAIPYSIRRIIRISDAFWQTGVFLPRFFWFRRSRKKLRHGAFVNIIQEVQ